MIYKALQQLMRWRISLLYTKLVLLFAFAADVCPSSAHAEKHLTRLSRSTGGDSSSTYETRFPNVTWDNDHWLLTTTILDQGQYQSRMVIANGYHGINVAALGPFFEVDTSSGDEVVINGWPLFDRRQTFATIGYFWDLEPHLNGTNYAWLSQYGWDTAISGIPHWSGIILDMDGTEILQSSTSSGNISQFTSTLDLRHGVMNWAFTWNTTQGPLEITYQMFAHKIHVNQGFVNMSVTAQKDVNITVVNVLNGDCALRTQFINKGIEDDYIFSAVQPNGVSNVTAYVYAGMTATGAQITSNQTSWNATYVGANQSSIATAMNVSLEAGRKASFVKYVGIASSDGFADPQATAKEAAAQAHQNGYSISLQSHSTEWEAIFPNSSVDDFTYPENGSLPNDPFIIDAAITAVTNPYYILQNTISENAMLAVNNASINDHSIAVGGLGSESYAGQIFWDADVWMQPGIVAAFPYAAQGISNYRLKLHPQAIENAQTSYVSSKNTTRFSSNAAIYPWTSGRYGNCTATGPCWDYEYHLNGDIVQAMTLQWQASGRSDFLENSLYPVHQSIATLYSELLEPNGSYWSLTNMTDPDEYSNNKDNGAFTMALVAQVLGNGNELSREVGNAVNQTWNEQARAVLIGKSMGDEISLEYTGPVPMNGSFLVKQADVVLIAYPLSYSNENYTATDALMDLDYYANKQSPDGPAMTYAIFSILANEVSPSGCSAFTYQQYSFQPYVRAPWYQFSEQEIDDPRINGGTNPAFPFLTGHGGANQVILFGYLGLRYIPDGFLHLDPAPPLQIPNIRYRTFYWQGWPIEARSNATHTTIERGFISNLTSGTMPNSTFSNAPIPVMIGPQSGGQIMYELPVNGSLVVRNRQNFLNKTVHNNIAQCQPVSSTDAFLPGQFPISAVDGAISTTWQPVYANQSASVTVQLPLGYIVEAFEFNWGNQPPYNFTVSFHNTTDITGADAQLICNSTQVEISISYNATEALEVRPIVGNTTILELNTTTPSVTSGLVYAAKYATLSIWGNQMNSSLTIDTMSGDGATVAEWSIIVAGDGMQSTGTPYVKKRSPSSSRSSSMLRNLDWYNAASQTKQRR